MNEAKNIAELIGGLGPEITLLIGATLCLALGLAGSVVKRRFSATVAAVALIVAAVIAWPDGSAEDPLTITAYVKVAVAAIGFLLLLVAVAVPDKLETAQNLAHHGALWTAVGPEHSERGEFFAFLLLSLTGVMLVGAAEDLVWLFLALELTSLPTYVLVAAARERIVAQEAGVKYFFLSAMAVAVFLYGFTLIYGATGSTNFDQIRAAVADDGASPILILGLMIALLGVSFKIAAVPMHFYAADVYQGATTPVTAFLAFVPKTAGFLAVIYLLYLVPGPLPTAVEAVLWLMAALTMTVGNVMGLLQNNVKRILAYSSIAHSGYMLVGVLGMQRLVPAVDPLQNGAAAVLFYLVAYGLANLAAFAVLGCLERRGEEAETLDDLAGLSRRAPGLAAIFLLSTLSLIGLPPLVGFVGKIYLFGAAVEQGYVALVVVAVVNSAISAVYYLRMVGAAYFRTPDEQAYLIEAPLRRTGAALATVGVVVLFFAAGPLVDAAHRAVLTQQPLPERPVRRAADARHNLPHNPNATDQPLADARSSPEAATDPQGP